jgi:hypothetical protein
MDTVFSAGIWSFLDDLYKIIYPRGSSMWIEHTKHFL